MITSNLSIPIVGRINMAESSGHINFTGAPDPARILQMLSAMNPEELGSMIEKMGKGTRTKFDPTTQDGIREHWNKIKKGEAEIQKMKKKGLHTVTTTQSWDVKRNLQTSSVDLSSYDQIPVKDLGLGTTHRGRILVGRVVGGGGFWSIASGTLLIEDLCESIMEIAVYNYQKETFAKDFPMGRVICVIEPYYKIRGDGSVGIRVDNPSEICDYSLPTTREGWKELGNSCIKYSPEMALACYESGLRAPNKAMLVHLSGSSSLQAAKEKKNKFKKKFVQGHLDLMVQVSKLLTNLAICQFNLKDFDSSLFCALLAFGLGLDRPKAAFWIAKSLSSSGLEDEARRFAAWYSRKDVVNSTSLCREFCLSSEDTNKLDGGALFVRNDTPSTLAKASQSLRIGNIEYEEDWLALKQRGNDLFKEGLALEASRCYLSALSTCPFLDAMFHDSVSHDFFIPPDEESLDILIITLYLQSFLISNKGAAWLTIEKTPVDSIDGVISMLCAALLNCYGNGRAWMRVARFLELQGRSNDATSFLEDAADVIKGQKLEFCFLENVQVSQPDTLKIIKSELEKRKRHAVNRSYVRDITPISTRDQLEQRVKTDANSGRSMKALEEEISTCEELYTMYKMMITFGDGVKAEQAKQLTGPTVDRILHDYCTDFLQTVGVPDGLDKSYVRRVLYWSYVRYRTDPWVRAMQWRLGWSDDGGSKNRAGKTVDENELFRRWQGNYPLKVISDNPAKYAKPGAIIDIRYMKPANSYESRIRSNFVNCPHRNEVFFQGTTHLAVGFNDLNSLMNCKWMNAPEEEFMHKPSRFVGLEMNPFNVAKALVITEMLSKPEITLDAVVQVWYSTVWSQETLSSFRRCIESVLDKGEHRLAPYRQNFKLGSFSAANVSNCFVSSYLHHWLSVKPISFEEARRLWLNNTMYQNCKMFQQISSFKRRQDKFAIIQYCLTGEVFGNSAFKPHGLNAVGSLTFWQCPEGSPPLDGESMFNAFAIEDLTPTFHEDKSRNIVEVFETKAIRDIGNMRSRLLDGTVSIELYVGVLKPLTENDGHDLVNFITTVIKPYTIGWSNVIDYMELGSFHDLGRAISSHGDVAHYGYSMNWPAETFGANIMDYDMFNQHSAAHYILDMALGENFHGNNPDKTNIIKALRNAAGANELFICPDHDTPLNSTSFITSIMTKEHWVKYFFRKAGGMKEVGKHFETTSEYTYQKTNCGFNIPGEEPNVVVPSPLHRISTQIYLGWTYDPNLKLQHSVLPPTKTDMMMLSSIFESLGKLD